MDLNVKSTKTQLEIWYCRSCRLAHMRAGDVRLSFDRGEFELLTHRVIELNYSEWDLGGLTPIRIGEGVALVEDVSHSSEIH